MAGYRKNPNAVSALQYDLVWCPKYRRPVLVDAVAERLEFLLRQKAAEEGVVIHSLEVKPDSVRLSVESDPTWAPAGIAARLKSYTSHVLRQEFPHLRSRLPTLWSRSYYVTSVGHISEAAVRSFIEDQHW